MRSRKNDPKKGDVFLENKTKAQFASITYPFGVEPTFAHCPICGKVMAELDEEETGKYTPCEHVAFIYSSEGGSVFQTEGYEKRTEKIDVDEYDEFRDFIEDTDYGDELLVLEISYGQMGCCGPSWYSEIFGFDYRTLKNPD